MAKTTSPSRLGRASARPVRREDFENRVRFSQLLFAYGPGALINLPNGDACIVAGSDTWTAGAEIEEPRLFAQLKNKYGNYRLEALRTPTSADVGGIPVYGFPHWFRCPRCQRMMPNTFECPRCRERTTPSRFVVICRAGHVDEFPWRAWPHSRGSTCRGEELYLLDSGTSNSLEDLEVRCGQCGKTKDMKFALGQLPLPCTGKRPWLGDQERDCQEPAQGALRGSLNVYFSVSASALTIPPFSNPVFQLLTPHLATLLGVDDDVVRRAILESLKKSGRLPADLDVDDAMDAVHTRAAERTGTEDLLEEEYDALIADPAPPGLHSPPPDFQTRVGKVPTGFESHLARLRLVDRLREVRALHGFTRVDPPESNATLAPLTMDSPRWLPAIETRGEGIFIELTEAELARWETKAEVQDRMALMARAQAVWRERRKLPSMDPPSARLVLLHSFAHLLIRELSLYCGYPMAALRERIFSSARMRGVLVYTATVDSAGALGGLVRMGEPARLAPVLMRLLATARWCSADPLCGEHEPDGELGSIVGAACHACLYLPENACQLGNRLLDRHFVSQGASHAGYLVEI